MRSSSNKQLKYSGYGTGITEIGFDNPCIRPIIIGKYTGHGTNTINISRLIGESQTSINAIDNLSVQTIPIGSAFWIPSWDTFEGWAPFYCMTRRGSTTKKMEMSLTGTTLTIEATSDVANSEYPEYVYIITIRED